MIKDLNKLAKEILEKNQYMTLGTSNIKGNPWVSPVVYTYDKHWNFYFVSIPDSNHCLNIEKIIKWYWLSLIPINYLVKG